MVPGEVIHRINQMLKGWVTYFKHAVAKRQFAKLGWYARTRACLWLRERQKGRKRMPWREFERRYIVPNRGWSSPGNNCSTREQCRIRYLYRGDTIPTPWTAPKTAA